MQFRRNRQSSKANVLACALLAALISLAAVAPAGAVVVTDNFNADSNYAFGVVGGIWNGSENMLNLNGGLYNANISNPGVLTVEDNGTFDPDGTPPAAGMGWEGGRSTAPFLYRNVPAGQDFTATVKVSAQTSGQWSAAGLIARAANSPTPPGTGADHTDENFVTSTTFRTDAANANEGNTLNKRIEAGAQVNDNNIVVNATTTEPLPLLVRMERVGGGITYRTWVSTDNGATYQFQSRVRPTAGNALRDPAVGMQVGLSYHNFGALAGTAQFDDFTLDTYAPLAAPGAPVIPASMDITLTRNNIAQFLVSNSTPGQGPLQWTLTADAANPAAPPTATTIRTTATLLPGGNGGQPAANDALGSPLPPFPTTSATNFRWNTAIMQNTAGGNMLPGQPWTPGTYRWIVRATNDWGQVSNDLSLTIRLIIPEPASVALIGLGIAALVGLVRRKR
jgi:hypothetical protein